MFDTLGLALSSLLIIMLTSKFLAQLHQIQSGAVDAVSGALICDMTHGITTSTDMTDQDLLSIQC